MNSYFVYHECPYFELILHLGGFSCPEFVLDVELHKTETRKRRIRRRSPFLRCLFLALVSLCGIAKAQHPERVTPVDPLQAERHLENLRLEHKRAKGPPPTIPKLTLPPVQTASGRLFRLRSVTIKGADTILPSHLTKAYRSFLGTWVTKRDLEHIAAAVSDVYRDAGYHLSRAIIPPQDVKHGRLTVRVIEGSITKIRLVGHGVREFGIREILEPILHERPSRLKTVERQLLLANNTPGVRVVDVALEEIGTASGRFRLIVRVKTSNIYAYLGLDNFGTYATGPVQSYAATSFNSLFRAGDVLSLNLGTVPDAVRDLRYGRVGYDVPIIDGVRIGASALQSEVMPDDERRLTDTRVLTRAYEFHVSAIALASRKNWLSLGAAVGVVNSSQTETTKPDYNDRVRTFGFLANYKFHDAFDGRNFATVGWRHGIDGFGATQSSDPLISRYGATPNFSILNYSYAHFQKLGGAWSFKASISGQFASGPLMTSQQFYLGGAAFGPGYYSGDDGYQGVAELRFDQTMTNQIFKAYQLYGFIDGGQTWYMHQDKQSLSSVGAGLRIEFANHIRANIAFAAPLSYTSRTEEWRRARVLFSISKAFRLCVKSGLEACP